VMSLFCAAVIVIFPPKAAITIALHFATLASGVGLATEESRLFAMLDYNLMTALPEFVDEGTVKSFHPSLSWPSSGSPISGTALGPKAAVSTSVLSAELNTAAVILQTSIDTLLDYLDNDDFINLINHAENDLLQKEKLFRTEAYKSIGNILSLGALGFSIPDLEDSYYQTGESMKIYVLRSAELFSGIMDMAYRAKSYNTPYEEGYLNDKSECVNKINYFKTVIDRLKTDINNTLVIIGSTEIPVTVQITETSVESGGSETLQITSTGQEFLVTAKYKNISADTINGIVAKIEFFDNSDLVLTSGETETKVIGTLLSDEEITISWLIKYIGIKLNGYTGILEVSAKPEDELNPGFTSLPPRKVIFSSLPFKDDDLDGLDDNWESKYSVDDPEADADSDDLKNIDEFQKETDPNNPDTDGDGLEDGEEVTEYETDPLNYDTDGGGEIDGGEVSLSKDPLNPGDDATQSVIEIVKPASLSKAFNLIMLNRYDSSIVNASDLAASIGSSIVEWIFRWDNFEQKYYPYSPNLPSTDFEIEAGRPYFVYVNNSTTWNLNGTIAIHSEPTYPEFNLIGLPTASKVRKASEFCDMISYATFIFEWDVATQNFKFYSSRLPTVTDFNVTPGKGYFVYCEEGSTSSSSSSMLPSSVPATEHRLPYMVTGEIELPFDCKGVYDCPVRVDAYIENRPDEDAYIENRPDELLTNNKYSCRIGEDGKFFVDCSAFPTKFVYGDFLIIEFYDKDFNLLGMIRTKLDDKEFHSVKKYDVPLSLQKNADKALPVK